MGIEFALRTALLLGLLTGILLSVGYLLGGTFGMTVFLFVSFLINFFAYWFSDRIILAIYQAKKLSKKEAPKLHSLVEKLAKEAGIPKPKLYLINLPSPNAFATGRSPKHSSIAVSSALLQALDEEEIEGVLSHEIAHIKNRDTLISTISATIAGTIAYLARFAWYGLLFGGREERGGSLIYLPLLILAPLAAMLIQLAISRTREYKADYTGALLSKKPLALASALEKIARWSLVKPLEGNPATSHLFIVNPFKVDGFTNLFSTHPPIQERIRRLKELVKKL